MIWLAKKLNRHCMDQLAHAKNLFSSKYLTTTTFTSSLISLMSKCPAIICAFRRLTKTRGEAANTRVISVKKK